MTSGPEGVSGATLIPETEIQRRRWYALAIMSIGSFMTPFDASIVAVALPKMGEALRLSYSEALWVQAAYLLVASILLIPVGRLADTRRPVAFNLLGTVIFAIGSVVAGMANGSVLMIIGRCIQGAGGAFMFATSAGIITAAFPPSAEGQGSGSERDRGVRRPDPGSGDRRGHRQQRQLAVDLLHQRAHRSADPAERLGAAARRRQGPGGHPAGQGAHRLGGCRTSWRRARGSVRPAHLLSALGLGEPCDHRALGPDGRVPSRLRTLGAQAEPADAAAGSGDQESGVRCWQRGGAAQLHGRVRGHHADIGLSHRRPGHVRAADRPPAAHTAGVDGRALSLHRQALGQDRIPGPGGHRHGAGGGGDGATGVRLRLLGPGPVRARRPSAWGWRCSARPTSRR